MSITLRQPFEDLTFMTPLSDAHAARLVGFLAGGRGGTVVDFGCGWAELLLRVVAADPAVRGVGIDSDEASIGHAEHLAKQRGLTDRITIIRGDAGSDAPESADAAICIGASHIWAPPSETSEPMDYAGALTAIRARVARGARVVYGEGIWSQPPTKRAIAPLGGRRDEMVPIDELLELAVSHGFMPIATSEASLQEWDEFESGYSACYAHWLATHDADDPEADDVRMRAARQREGYFHGYRGILGMAYLSLIAV